MATSVQVSRQAYGKIFLHAAKYFDSLLIGFVIGHKTDGKLTVTDILPVSHTNPAGPILEIAGDVADALFQQPNQIVGIYYASEDVNSEHPAYNVQRIIDGISETLGHDGIVLRVNNKLLSSKDKVFLEGSRGKVQLKVELTDPMLFISSLLDAMLLQKIERLFVDFEDHMNSSADVSAGGKGASDFRNPIASNFVLQYKPTV